MSTLRSVNANTLAADAIDTINALLKGGPDPRLVVVLDALLSGQSQLITTMSDSTGVGYFPQSDPTNASSSKRGFRRTFEQILTALGPTVRGEWYQYNGTTSSNEFWEGPEIVQAGSLGERGFTFDGTTNTRTRQLLGSTAPYTAFSADFEFEVRFTPNTVTPTAYMTIMNRGGGGARGPQVNVMPSGELQFAWASAGANDATITSVTSVGAALSTSAINHFKCAVQASNGNGGYTATISKSTDNGKTWTVIGTPVATTSGGATAQDRTIQTASWELGGRGNTSSPFNGTIYKVQFRDGINGAPMLPAFIEAFNLFSGTAGGTVGGATLKWYNGAVAGKNLQYMLGLDGAGSTYAAPVDGGNNRFNKLVHPFTPGALFLNNGHNESSTAYSGDVEVTGLNLWKAKVSARNPITSLNLIVQNPEVPGTTVTSQQTADIHINRMRQIQGWATQNGVMAVDAMSAIYQYTRDNNVTLASIMQPDGVHPLDPPGYIAWATALCRKFGVATPTA